eukprot:CAMPEP_0113306470 /NCGR_PEP_ID=MMETSP0010_2-20120614/5706_1 /TAXON_ID=216773 ORGANISM="Corethron hystrix, Strain 308" /NCGR_SAMPLE_ID=MMETSP0010_2 /ASSEMBLY_ACC=CAM_ASM_000155 /LENGTH=797 /DNA_ID=CAMNT_0000161139 /DNA_START=87 /DNA_END=2477 /DNA_ORIENTATION=+ /assembly_acc=CAM_ASM_000155
MIIWKNAVTVLTVTLLSTGVLGVQDLSSPNTEFQIDDLNKILNTELVLSNSMELHEMDMRTKRQINLESSGINGINTNGEPVKYPFVICDYAHGADGLTRSREISNVIGEESDLAPIYNQDDKSCFSANLNADQMNSIEQEKNIASVALSKDMKVAGGTYYEINKRIGESTNPIAFHFELNVIAEVTTIESILTTAEGILGENCADLVMKTDNSYMNIEYELDEETSKEFVLKWIKTNVAQSGCMRQFLSGMAESNEVVGIEMTSEKKTSNYNAAWVIQRGVVNNKQTPFWDAGITGAGQFVQVTDTGVDTSHCFFRDNNGDVKKNKKGDWQPNLRKVVQYYTFVDDSDYIEGHGTHVCGTVLGNTAGGNNDKGMAPDAKLAFYDIGDGGGYLQLPVTQNAWLKMCDVAYSKGAFIHSASWGAQTASYNLDSKWFDEFTWRNPKFLTFIAAGNSGPSSKSIGAPATAKNILSVGATQKAVKANKLTNWSSRGPTNDGRMGPMIVAPGDGTNSASAGNNNGCQLVQFSGTSMATPAAAGAAALVRQYFAEGWYENGKKGSGSPLSPSAALVKAIMINGAVKISTGSMYDNSQGFGRISLFHSLPLSGENMISLFFKDEETIKSKKVNSYSLKLKNTSQCSMRVSLVWTDQAGASNCNKCLLNDIDLNVRINNGNVLYPNGKSNNDRKNNAERVVIPAANLKDNDMITITVRAVNLNVNELKYSVVAVGCFKGDAVPGPTPSPVESTDPPTKFPTFETESPVGSPTIPPPTKSPTKVQCKDDKKFKFFDDSFQERNCKW